MGVGAGHAHKNIHIHTHAHTVSLHPLLNNGLSDHLFNTVNKQDKTAGGLLRQCNPTLKWVEHTELHTHVGSQVYTCPNVHSQKRKCLPIESLNKNHSCILRKTLSSNGFIRATESLTKLSFFHPFPIFLLAFGLHPGGSRFGKLYLLWNHTLSFSRQGRAPEAMHHLECCVSTQPPSGGSHQHCAALVCASQAPPPPLQQLLWMTSQSGDQDWVMPASKHHFVWYKAERIHLKHMWQIESLTTAMLW